MPSFIITGPDGKEYEVTAPDGTNEQQVLQYVQQQVAMPQPKEKSTLGEIGRQIGLTARAGITGLTSLPAMLAEPVAAGVNAIAGKKIMESPTKAVQNLMTAAGIPEPQGRLERAVQAGASAVAGTGAQTALAGRAGGAFAPLAQDASRQLVISGAAAPVAQATGEKVMEETDSPLAATIAALAAGTVAGAAASKGVLAARGKTEPAPVTLDDIRTKAKQAYSTMDNLGVEVKPQPVLNALDNVRQKLLSNNFNPKLDAHRPVAQVLDQVEEMVGQQRVSFTKLDQMRSALNDLKMSRDPATRNYAGQAVQELDGFITSLSPKDVISGKQNVGEAVSVLKEARQSWRNLSRANVLQDALNVAEARALDPKASEGELIRRSLINLAASKDKMRLFSPSEQNAIKSVIKGGTADPLLSLVARFNPERSQLVTAGTAFAAGANPVAAGVTAAAGFGADRLLSAQRQAATNRLISNIATGTIPEIPPTLSWRGLLSSVPQQ